MRIEIRTEEHMPELEATAALFELLRAPEDSLDFHTGAPTGQSADDAGAASDANDREESKTTISIDIRSSGDQRTISIDCLDTRVQTGAADFVGTLNRLVASAMGYSGVLLHGLRVKDSTGNRIKPVIAVYVASDVRLQLPSDMEFTKESAPSGRRPAWQCDLRVASDSPIILSLAEKAPVRFTAPGCSLLFHTRDGVLLATPEVPKLPRVLDALTCTTFRSEVDRMLEQGSSRCLEVMRRIVATPEPSAADVTEFYKQAAKTLDAAERRLLIDIVENFPALQDGRDAFIEGLRIYLDNGLSTERLVMCDYLKIVRRRAIKQKCRFSLKSFSAYTGADQ
ncbi:hypothetical protein PAPHI01_0590 [Pancytospora philotis]|nr:hypothetical protein PAPHI01_0590 [Pancytospora philotis]